MPKSHRNKPSSKKHILTVSTASKPPLVDRITFIAAIVEPVMTIPQAWTIFHTKSAAGISLSTWICYLVFGFVWVWYGFVHKQRLIIFYELLYVVVEILIITGGLLYGAKW